MMQNAILEYMYSEYVQYTSNAYNVHVPGRSGKTRVHARNINCFARPSGMKLICVKVGIHATAIRLQKNSDF